MDEKTRPAGMKIFPRNLTARAARIVRGNPVVSRPESGADNSHPGLELDQRNLDCGFFPGLLFDFQFDTGARLAKVLQPWLDLEKTRDGHNDLETSGRDFRLWYICGRFGDQPDRLSVADVYGVDGYDVLRKVHDLEPGPLAIVIGLDPQRLKLDKAEAWMAAARSLLPLAAPLMARTSEERLQALRAVEQKLKLEPSRLETFRDSEGNLQVAVLVSSRANYLDSEGVIELQTAEPGALTRSLCSPWQWDFADCGCYYWAASRPDIVTVTHTDGRMQRVNYLRTRAEEENAVVGDDPSAGNALTWAEWMDPTKIMSQQHFLLDWEGLPLVIDDREATHFEVDPPPSKDGLWKRSTVVRQLKHLAAVEHALCVKFLYAYYSVNTTDDRPEFLEAAHEIRSIAIDEMHHFRWVNEALLMLGEQPVFSRAKQLSSPPGGFKKKQYQTALYLEGLTPEAVDRFIEIERPSQKDDPDEIAGLYTHILLSLQNHKDREAEYPGDIRERLQEIVKLIIDEGGNHWHRFVRVQEALRSFKPDDYLQFTSAPSPQPAETESGRLQLLGDHYYQVMLESLRQAFLEPPQTRGQVIRQARRVMHNLDEVGCLLSAQSQGLLFTVPSRSGPGGSLSARVSRTFGTSVKRLLAGLRASESGRVRDFVARHEQAASELQQFFGAAARNRS